MDWWIEFDRSICEYLPDLKVVCDESMSRHTSFRIGGPAKRMAFPANAEQLVLLMKRDIK
jgi:UDP-N-acetylmuramate dehydrogenase